MPRAQATGESAQFSFLISCIRHSMNGKIDFEKVKDECEIVTKGAAAKRYERMMKQHGIHQPTGPTGRDTGVQPLKPNTTTKAKAKTDKTDAEPPTKKRKRSQPKKEKSPSPDEDDEQDGSVKGEANEGHESDGIDEDYEDADADGDLDVEPFLVKDEVSA